MIPEILKEKWPKLNEETMSTRGAKALASAIILKTAEDYYRVCDHPDKLATRTRNEDTFEALMTKDMIEQFIDSELFFVISPIDRDIFRKKIREMKDKKIPFPKSVLNATSL